MRRTLLFPVILASASTLLMLAAWRGDAQRGNPPGGGGPPPPPVPRPLPDLTPDQLTAFRAGAKEFTTVETRADGLGVVFNGVACAECHRAGGAGGAGMDLTVSRVSRIGGIRKGVYSDLAELGGPVIQARSLREFFPDCPVPGEIVPPSADFKSHRITTPLFGAGLIEAIPDAAILSRSGKVGVDGVQGVANRVLNPETGLLEVGRFGWKAQHSSLHLFAGDAYLNEMGVSSPSFPVENQPQGKPIPPGWGGIGVESDGTDVNLFTDFMRFLGAPLPARNDSVQQAGARLFDQIHCSACHVPTMQTGSNSVAALSHKNVALYSDLLLHRMGPALADGIQQGQSKGDQWRTAPLWGLSSRQFFLHDGRARTPDEAVLLHDGEAAPSRNRYRSLSPPDRRALQQWLSSL